MDPISIARVIPADTPTGSLDGETGSKGAELILEMQR